MLSLVKKECPGKLPMLWKEVIFLRSPKKTTYLKLLTISFISMITFCCPQFQIVYLYVISSRENFIFIVDILYYFYIVEKNAIYMTLKCQTLFTFVLKIPFELTNKTFFPRKYIERRTNSIMGNLKPYLIRRSCVSLGGF